MASIQKRPDGKWRARYRDPDRREHAKHFARKVDAQRWLTAVEADMLRGSYLELHAIRPSTVQAWLRGRQEEAAPTYVRVMLANLSAMLGAAVEDGLIARNPCQARTVKAPALGGSRVQPWPTERVLAVADALPARYRATTVAAGDGASSG